MYLPTYSPRFSPNWKRILFRGDVQLQHIELYELQEVVQKAQEKMFSFLYGETFYSTKAIAFSLLEVTAEAYILSYTDSQYYLNGIFIDLPAGEIEVSKEDSSLLSIQISFEERVGREYNDPLTGGEFSGDSGASRLVVTSELVANEDGYPVALTFPKSDNSGPVILLYENYQFVSEVRGVKSPEVEKLLNNYLKDVGGNFIVRGLKLSTKGSKLTISPGLAYIDGTRVYISTTLYYEIPEGSEFVSVELDKEGNLITANSLQKTSPKYLTLGVVVSENEEYKVSQSSNRALSNYQLVSLRESLEKLEREVAALAVKRQQLDTERETTLRGLVVDSFGSLVNSDINHPLFTASIIPQSFQVRAGASSTSLDLSNISDVVVDGSSILLKGGEATYICPRLVSRALVSQPRVTDSIVLGTAVRTASMQLSPSRGQIADSKVFRITALFRDRPLSSYDLLARRVTVSCSGLPAFEDNLRVFFGDVEINSLELINLTQAGTQVGVRAKRDGTASFSFLIPNNLPFSTYVVRLENSRVSARAIFNAEGIDNQPTAATYPLTSNVAQSFNVSSPVTLTGLRLKFKSAPDVSADLVLAQVGIASLVNNLPSQAVLTKGDLLVSQLANSTSTNGSRWVEVSFDKPISISAGQYAIVISSALTGAELFVARRGSRDLIDGQVLGVEPLLGGNFFTNQSGIWVADNSTDLSFELVQGLPQLQSSIEFTLTNPQESFNQLEIKAPFELPAGCQVRTQYLENNIWKDLSGVSSLSSLVNFIRARFLLTSTPTSIPIIEADNFSANLFSTLRTSSWISQVTRVEKYSSVELNLESFSPAGTQVRVYISSNEGQNWEELAEVSREIEDPLLPTYKITYKKENLSRLVPFTEVNGNSFSIERDRISVRIDFELTEGVPQIPFARNLKTITRAI